MSEELKPCPFCGGNPRVIKWGIACGIMYDVEINCRNKECGAYQKGTTSIRDGESSEQARERAYQIAKEKWNRRFNA